MRPNTKMMFQNTKVTPQNTKHQEMLVQIYTKGCTKHQGERKKWEMAILERKIAKKSRFWKFWNEKRRFWDG